MTVLVAVVLYGVALLVVLLLVGGVRRGDRFHARSLRSMRSANREPVETPRSERYSAPWSKPPKKPGRAAAEHRGRSAAQS